MREVKRLSLTVDEESMNNLLKNLLTSISFVSKFRTTAECELFVDYLAKDFKGFSLLARRLRIDCEKAFLKAETSIQQIESTEESNFSLATQNNMKFVSTILSMIDTIKTEFEQASRILLPAKGELELLGNQCSAIYEELVTIDTRLAQNLTHEIERLTIFDSYSKHFMEFFGNLEGQKNERIRAALESCSSYQLPPDAKLEKIIEIQEVNVKGASPSAENAEILAQSREVVESYKRFTPKLDDVFRQCVESGSTNHIVERTIKAKDILASLRDELTAITEANLAAERQMQELIERQKEAEASSREFSARLSDEQQQKEELIARIKELKAACQQNDAQIQQLNLKERETNHQIEQSRTEFEAIRKAKEDEIAEVQAKMKQEDTQYRNLIKKIKDKTAESHKLEEFLKESASIESLNLSLDVDIVVLKDEIQKAEAATQAELAKNAK